MLVHHPAGWHAVNSPYKHLQVVTSCISYKLAYWKVFELQVNLFTLLQELGLLLQKQESTLCNPNTVAGWSINTSDIITPPLSIFIPSVFIEKYLHIGHHALIASLHKRVNEEHHTRMVKCLFKSLFFPKLSQAKRVLRLSVLESRSVCATDPQLCWQWRQCCPEESTKDQGKVPGQSTPLGQFHLK